MRARALWAFAPYAVLSIVQVIAIGAGADALTTVSKAVLMPALAGAVLVAAVGPRKVPQPVSADPESRVLHLSLRPALLLVAIGLSWVGDLALMVPGDLWFVVGLGSFLLAHVAYLALFVRTAGVGRPRAWSLVYAVWFVVFLLVLIPHLGTLVAPVVVYGLVLGTMATVATRMSPLVALGAAVFVVSDSTLALARFLPAAAIPGHDVTTMLTYCVAQGLIAWGVQALARRDRSAERSGWASNHSATYQHIGTIR